VFPSAWRSIFHPITRVNTDSHTHLTPSTKRKAILLAACARHCRIPALIGLADVLKQKAAYGIMPRLVSSEMEIRDRHNPAQ
ncbi:hypothetical protein Q2374_28620, partial [Escherichia coli]|nr:hypothetical protein [Escherichia coli]